MKRGYYWLGRKRPTHSKRMSGMNNPRFGKSISDEMKKKLSIENSGENSNLWKGGITLEKARYRRERRNRERHASGSHTLGEWETLKAQYNWICPHCLRKEPEVKLTRDHIIPLIKGGSDNIENIQPLCHSCNSRKGTKILLN